MIWKNSEGYYDPTAGEALSRIIRDERKKRRAEREADKKEEHTEERKGERHDGKGIHGQSV